MKSVIIMQAKYKDKNNTLLKKSEINILIKIHN